jgi:hypothetical protein
MAAPGEPLRWDDPDLHYDDPRLYWDQPFPATTNMNNRISAVLAAQAVTNTQQAIATIRTNLPFLVQLNADDRQKMAHGGSKSQGVIQLGLDFTAQYPGALPADFNVAEFAKDGTLHDAFEALALSVGQLNDDIQGTLMVLNGELFLQFLDVYAYAKANNRDGRYNTFVNAVKVRFAKTPKPRPPPR